MFIRRISRINASISGLLAIASLLTAGCSSAVTSEDGNGSTELSLDQGSETYLTGFVGDGTTCQTPDVWKLQSYEDCLSQGLTLVELTFANDCADGLSTSAKYACGEASPVPTPQDPVPAPQDPGSCIALVLGDGTTCRSPVEWESILNGSDADEGSGDVCHGIYLTNVVFPMDCADSGSTMVGILCCSTANAPTEPEPVPVCTEGALGDWTICATAEEWTTKAEEICAQKGLTNLQMSFSEDCADGGSSYAKFDCCEP